MIEVTDEHLILLTMNGYQPSGSKDGIFYRAPNDSTNMIIDFRGDVIKAYGFKDDKRVCGDIKLMVRLRILTDKEQTKLFDEDNWRKEELD